MYAFFIIYAVIALATAAAICYKFVTDAQTGGWDPKNPHAAWQLMGTIIWSLALGAAFPATGLYLGIKALIKRYKK